MDPKSFSGTLYAATHWRLPGASKGHVRSNGRYTELHGNPSQRHGLPLRRDACRRLRALDALLAAWSGKPGSRIGVSGALPSIDATIAQIDDVRRSQGCKPCMASVLSMGLLSRLMGHTDPVAAAALAASFGQTDLVAIGSWKNTVTGCHEPVSKSTLHRVIQTLDPEQRQAVLQRHGQPRLHIAQAIAVDGNGLCGANRNSEDHHETVTLVEHGGDIAAVRAVLGTLPIAGRVITLDALHTTRDTARIIVGTHKADDLFTIKRNAPETWTTLTTREWQTEATGHCQDEVTLAHGRIEQRSIAVFMPPQAMINDPHVNRSSG